MCSDENIFIFRELPMNTLNHIWSPNDLHDWNKQTLIIYTKVDTVQMGH